MVKKKAKAINAILLELNLKNKLEETGKKKQEEMGRNIKNQRKLDDTKRNRKKQGEKTSRNRNKQ